MENLNNADQERVDQTSGGPLEGMSPQNTNLPEDRYEDDVVAYAGLGVNNDPDVMNPGSEEATDTLLYTDTVTALHATDEIRNTDDLSDDELLAQMDREIEADGESGGPDDVDDDPYL